MRVLILLAASCVSALAAEWKIVYSAGKGLRANYDTPVYIAIADANKKPVNGADVEVVLTMVDMDHGEFKHLAKQIKPGFYQANVKFIMVGAWQVEVKAKKGDDTQSEKFRQEITQ
jgi:nitrogen fixation protein FixH